VVGLHLPRSKGVYLTTRYVSCFFHLGHTVHGWGVDLSIGIAPALSSLVSRRQRGVSGRRFLPLSDVRSQGMEFRVRRCAFAKDRRVAAQRRYCDLDTRRGRNHSTGRCMQACLCSMWWFCTCIALICCGQQGWGVFACAEMRVRPPPAQRRTGCGCPPPSRMNRNWPVRHGNSEGPS